jgi:hypothetical protein
MFSLPLFASCALAGAFLFAGIAERQAMIGSACSLLATALAVHLKRVPVSFALPLSVSTGLWSGAVAAASAQFSSLVALPLVLLLFPARWIVQRDRAIVLQVLSGWLVAVALLMAALPLITTAGYEPDHME